MKIICLVITMACFAQINLFAQEPSDTVQSNIQLSLLVKNDGTEYIGEIISDDGREVLIMTKELGKIYIQKSDIKSITKIENESDIVYGEYRVAGPFTTRYSFTTNALPIQKGENYALINLYGPEVHFAVTDQLSLGVMTTWIASPFVAAGKYTFNTDTSRNFNVSIGSLIGTTGYLNNFRGYGGLHFMNFTVGSRSTNMTFSGGYAHLLTGSREWYPDEGVVINNDSYSYSYYDTGSRRLTSPIHGPIFSIAGIAKVGAKTSFVFDSMIGVFSQKDIGTNTTTMQEPFYDEFGSYSPGIYRHETLANTSRTTALFIMPGMRFQKTEKSAFQISLTGVTVFSWADEIGGSESFSFPMPQLMWFFKF